MSSKHHIAVAETDAHVKIATLDELIIPACAEKEFEALEEKMSSAWGSSGEDASFSEKAGGSGRASIVESFAALRVASSLIATKGSLRNEKSGCVIEAIRDGEGVFKRFEVTSLTKQNAKLAVETAFDAKGIDYELLNLGKEVERRSLAMAREKVVGWFESVAGEGSSELARKVLGDGLTKAKLVDVEMIAANAKQLWAALEGQEALGLFSIEVARTLEWDLPGLLGRGLADKCKTAMSSKFGLTSGGWRLLGKLESGGDSGIAAWHKLLKSHDTSPTAPKRAPGASLDGLSSVEEYEQAWVESAACSALFLRRDLRALCMLLSAGASVGMQSTEMDKALKAMAGQFTAGRVFIAGPRIPKELTLAEGQAEWEAFRKKAPAIIARFLEKSCAEGLREAFASFMLVTDWARNSEFGMWQELPSSPKWSDVSARQRQWHEMIQARGRDGAAAISWACDLPSHQDDEAGCSATALTDGGMLWDEGRAMHHCVSTYAEECSRGESLIFSIRKDGRREATLQLVYSGDRWVQKQLSGVCNAAIKDELVVAFCADVEAKHQSAWSAKSQKGMLSSEDDLAAKIAARRGLQSGPEEAKPPTP